MTDHVLHIPPEWREASEEILEQGGPVLVLGAPGSGKTTLCRYLTGAFCRRGLRVAWLDADPGQPFIGPPAVFSLALYTDAADLPRTKPPFAMGFIGNTSPVGHLLEAVAAIHKLAEKSSDLRPDLLLINTCGLVNGGAARELKFHEIDLIAPKYVLALQEKNEVEHLLAPHAHRRGLLIRRLPVSPDARPSSGEARRASREKRFKEYFRGADFQEIHLTDVGIHGHGLGTGDRLGFRDINLISNIIQAVVVHAELAADRLFIITDGEYAEDELFTVKEQYSVREVIIVKRSELDHLLVGLSDDQNACLGLGIIRDLDLKELSLQVITPLRDPSTVRHINLGTLRVNPAGNELGQW